MATTLPARQVGLSVGPDLLWESPAEQARDLDAIAATGAKWLRLDFYWPSIQPGPTTWNWAPWDALLAMTNARNLKVLGVATYTPQWTRTGASSTLPPADPTGLWAAYLDTVVRRYAPMGVHAWEVWNEPNNAGSWATPDPVAYTRLLQASWHAIKGADPTAQVITGGLSPAAVTSGLDPVGFVQAMYAAGAHGYFDAIAVHPYSFPWHPTDPTTASWNTFLRVPLVHDAMVAAGDGAKRVWLTEYGAPTGSSNGAVTEADQALFATEGFAAIAAWPYAGQVFWYSHRDRGTNLADREDNFGLVRFDHTAKPVLAAFTAAIRRR